MYQTTNTTKFLVINDLGNINDVVIYQLKFHKKEKQNMHSEKTLVS